MRAHNFKKGSIVKGRQLKPDGEYVDWVKPQGVDTIPAILQPGELVVNKSNVKAVLKLIDIHNEKAPPHKDIIIPGLVDDGEQSSGGDILELSKGGKVKRKKKSGLPLKVSLDTRKPIHSISVRFTKPQPRQPRQKQGVAPPPPPPLGWSISSGPPLVRGQYVSNEPKVQKSDSVGDDIKNAVKSLEEGQKKKYGELSDEIKTLTEGFEREANKFIFNVENKFRLISSDIKRIQETGDTPNVPIILIPPINAETQTETINDDIEVEPIDNEYGIEVEQSDPLIEESEEIRLKFIDRVEKYTTINELISTYSRLPKIQEGVWAYFGVKSNKNLKKTATLQPRGYVRDLLKNLLLEYSTDINNFN